MNSKAIVTEALEVEVSKKGAAIPGKVKLNIDDFAEKKKSKVSVNSKSVLIGTLKSLKPAVGYKCKNPNISTHNLAELTSEGFSFTGIEDCISVEQDTIHLVGDFVTCKCEGKEVLKNDPSKFQNFTGECTVKIDKSGQGTDDKVYVNI